MDEVTAEADAGDPQVQIEESPEAQVAPDDNRAALEAGEDAVRAAESKVEKQHEHLAGAEEGLRVAIADRDALKGGE